MFVSVVNYDKPASANSETDDETTMCSDGDGVDRDKDLGGPAVGVPSLEASPRMGHALLSLKGAEVREGFRNFHQDRRLADNITNMDAHKKSSGESQLLKMVCDGATGAALQHSTEVSNCWSGLWGSLVKLTGSNRRGPGEQDPERNCSLAMFGD